MTKTKSQQSEAQKQMTNTPFKRRSKQAISTNKKNNHYDKNNSKNKHKETQTKYIKKMSPNLFF